MCFWNPFEQQRYSPRFEGISSGLKHFSILDQVDVSSSREYGVLTAASHNNFQGNTIIHLCVAAVRSWWSLPMCVTEYSCRRNGNVSLSDGMFQGQKARLYKGGRTGSLPVHCNINDSHDSLTSHSNLNNILQLHSCYVHTCMRAQEC